VSAGLNVGVSRLDRYNTSGNIGYQAGRLTTFTSVGLNQDARAIVGINDRERYDALRALTSVTAQDVSSEVDNGRQNFTTSVDYRLTNRDLFSNSITLNRRTGIDESVAAYTELDGSRSMTDRYDRPRNADTRGYLIDYTSALKRTITQRKHEIGGELRYTQSRDDDITTLWRQPAAGSGGSIVELERQSTDALTSTFNAQLDYLRPLGKNGKLETGYKGTIRLLDRDYLVQKDPAGSGTWTTSGLSNDFEFDETVNAVYGVASNRAGKFDLQGGLRAEYASREFSLSTSRYPYSYTSLFPSGVVMYNLSAQNQLKASYSRRIRRPGTQELNPFPSFFDVQTVFMGNPALNPEYTDAIELGYVRNMKLGTFQFSPFFRHTSDVIRVDINTADVVDGREVTSVSFKNLDKSDSWGADINGSLRLGPKFSGFASFNVFKMVTDGGSQSALSSDAVAWSGRVNGTTQLNKTLTMQASYFYRAPMKIEKGTFAAQHMAFFSFRQKVNGEKAAITLRINDPFGTGAFKIKAGDDNVIQITERDFGSRMVFLGFQYTYGQTPRVREPRPQEQQEGGVRFQ
jgi:outer membrane receptor protein involved in Fe transport